MGGGMREKRGPIIAACAAALAAGGGAAAAAGAGQQPEPKPSLLNREAPAVQSVQAEQAQVVGQLRRSRSSDDDLPAAWAERLTSGDRAWGANPALARRTAPGVWLVPADGVVCVAFLTRDQSLGFGCAPPEAVKRGMLAPSEVGDGGFGLLTGVVPDGVEAVNVVDRDGAMRSVNVRRNTYRTPIDTNTAEVRFTDADGAERVLPMTWSP